MAKLYVITGPAGVGKSTISKALAVSLEKSVLIEGDDIYNQVIGSYTSPWKKGNHLAIFWEVCISTIQIYLNAGYDVVFNYIINREDINRISSIFNNVDLKFVVLLCDKETLLKRDSERVEDCQMKDRCVVLLQQFLDNSFDEKYILYTDNLTVDKCVFDIQNNQDYFMNIYK